MRHESEVQAASFSSDGRRVVTASWDKTARLWDAETGNPVGEPMRHESLVYAASFSPDGRHIVHGLPRPATAPGTNPASAPGTAGANRDVRWTLAIDNVPVGPEFDGFPIGSRIRWSDRNSVTAVSTRQPRDMPGPDCIDRANFATAPAAWPE